LGTPTQRGNHPRREYLNTGKTKTDWETLRNVKKGGGGDHSEEGKASKITFVKAIISKKKKKTGCTLGGKDFGD